MVAHGGDRVDAPRRQELRRQAHGLGSTVDARDGDGDIRPGNAEFVGGVPEALESLARHRKGCQSRVDAVAHEGSPIAVERKAQYSRPRRLSEGDESDCARRRAIVDADERRARQGRTAVDDHRSTRPAYCFKHWIVVRRRPHDKCVNRGRADPGGVFIRPVDRNDREAKASLDADLCDASKEGCRLRVLERVGQVLPEHDAESARAASVSERALGSGPAYPIRDAIANTFSRVLGATRSGLLNVKETVMSETPASRATSAMVARALLSCVDMSQYYLFIVKQIIERKPRADGISAIPVFAGFATFGSFWGTWGASIPRVKAQAGIDDGQLGVALLFIGLGALPTMFIAGRAVDRWGSRVSTFALLALGLSGVASVALASDLPGLCVGLPVVGAASGGSDVAINSTAGRAGRGSAQPVIARANGVFSSFVVLSSLATGLLSPLGLPAYLPFLVVVLLSLVAGILMERKAGRPTAAPRTEASVGPAGSVTPAGLAPLLLIGALGALALASENAYQNWGALIFQDVLHSGPALSALAPAVFAGVVAVTRFSIGAIRPGHSMTILLIGALTAATGATVLAAAGSIVIAVLGLAIAAAGTGALYPTLLSIVSSNVSESRRGRATSLVALASYLAFLAARVRRLRGASRWVARRDPRRGRSRAVLLILIAPLLKLSVSRSAVSPRHD